MAHFNSGVSSVPNVQFAFGYFILLCWYFQCFDPLGWMIRSKSSVLRILFLATGPNVE